MSPRLGWPAVIQWTALTLLGVVLAGAAHFPGGYGALTWGQEPLDLGSGVVGFIFGAVSGLFIAGPQALLLRAWGVPVRAWLLWNAAGYGLVHALADGLAYRSLIIVGGGLIMAVCQYLALRSRLTRPLAWLPVAMVAWWLGFGLTAGALGYNLLVVALLLGTFTGLALRAWLIVSEGPAAPGWWLRAGWPLRAAVVVFGLAGLAVFSISYAGLSGLTSWFTP